MTTERAEIGTVPHHWEIAPLANFLELITYGFTNPMPDTEDGPWKVTAKDVVDGYINYDSARHTSREAFHENLTDKSKPRIDDILLTKDGSIGRVAVVDRDGICINQSVALLRPNDKILPHFLKYLLLTPHYQEVMERDSDGSTIKHIYITRVDKMQVAVPPIDEQKSILSVIQTLDDKIELNRRMNETLEAIARAIFKSWFVDFDTVRAKANGESPESICRRLGLTPELLSLFPDRFQDSELGEIPERWEVSEVGDVVKVVGGATPSTKNPEYWDGGTIHWATPKDFSTLSSRVLLDTERKITALGLRQISSGLLPAGTVLLSSRAPIGYLALSAVPISVNQGFIAMVCDGPMSSYYMLHWCEENLDQIRQRAGGTTFAEISKSTFRPIKLVIPRKAIGDQFDSIVKPIFAMVIERNQEISTLANLRDTLLPRLLSGELAVPTLDGETA
jgi:type I restriction enzyme S subunit